MAFKHSEELKVGIVQNAQPGVYFRRCFDDGMHSTAIATTQRAKCSAAIAHRETVHAIGQSLWSRDGFLRLRHVPTGMLRLSEGLWRVQVLGKRYGQITVDLWCNITVDRRKRINGRI